VPEDYYMGTRRVLWDLHADRLRWKTVDMRDPDRVRAQIVPGTKLVWIETPSNPRLHLTDIEAIAAIAHAKGAALVVDGTWATPVLTRPLELGADVVIHSATKYMGGHSDVAMGALVFKEKGDLFEDCRLRQWAGGAVPSPQDCWLVRRGLMTMPLRMERHCENALAVAKWLAKRPEVSAVHYPGLATGKQLALAKKQMQGGFGGVVSFQLKGGEKAAKALPRAMKIAVNATSLGGVESLIEQRRASEGPDSPTPADLVRFSVGIEDVADLVADLEQALAQVG
jgi:cystathionine gamma-synthase